jgi:hypothetical protein
VGAVLLGPYLLGVEIASMLLLAGLVGAYHLARRDSVRQPQPPQPQLTQQPQQPAEPEEPRS